jgi:hypothetical protein
MLENVAIETPQDVELAAARVNELIRAGKCAEAIAFADVCERNGRFVDAIRAIACMHGGEVLEDETILERGIELWRSLGGD